MMTSFLQDFLNKRNIPFTESDNGLLFHFLEKGSGTQAVPNDYVRVHYTGSFLDGRVFDSSVERGEPIVFKLGAGQVIPGWDQGIALLSQGDKAKLYIPPELAYGEAGAGDAIPPNSFLQFEVELVEILSEEAYKTWSEEEDARRRKMIEEYIEQQMRKELSGIVAYAKQEDIDLQMTDSGLFYHLEQAGEGEKAVAGKTVSVHYTGRLLSGEVFDSSHQRNEPIQFELGAGRVIQGWDEGIALFRVGGKGKLVVPSPLGYGPRAMGSIPAESTLVFDIELVAVD